jgi:predicted nucleic acid-binding protein
MKEFFDTSEIAAAFWRGHSDHEPSLKLVSAANKRKSACAAHTLAEVYATMTALPVKDVIPTEQARLLVVNEWKSTDVKGQSSGHPEFGDRLEFRHLAVSKSSLDLLASRDHFRRIFDS